MTREIAQDARQTPLIDAPPERDEVREYIGSLAVELARMAETGGDERLAHALDVVVDFARRPVEAPDRRAPRSSSVRPAAASPAPRG